MATYYLKYRPQTIEDLDLDSVRFQLTKVLESKAIPHAFLFSGPRGLGKTSAARILAKAINCEKPKGIEPCNACDTCISITKGSAVDVIEIDGASNRGIDDIRALRESVPSAPLRLKRKVYVIDEVHMLTKEAFNALLKTLEEPPDHVVFILATTEPHKVPETVISRTFHVQFQRASEAEVKRSLLRVIKGEKLEVADAVLGKIIARAEGGFRDSTKMLEQMAFVSKQIDESVFENVFPQANISQFLEYLAERNAQEALIWIRDQNQQAIDWEEIIRNLLQNMRIRLLSSYGIGEKQDDLFTVTEIKELMTLLLQAGALLKTSLIATLPLELAVAQWCTESDETASSNSSPVPPKEEKTNPVDKATSIKPSVIVPKKSPVSVPKEPSKPVAKEHGKHADLKAPFTLSLDDVEAKWDVLLSKVRTANLSVEALLRSSRLEDVLNDTVVIKVYYEFHKGRLEMEKHLQIVEEAFEKVFGAKPKLRYILGEKHEKKQLDQKNDDDLSKAVEEIFN